MGFRKAFVGALLGASMFTGMPGVALGQGREAVRHADFPAQDLASALRAVGLTFGVEIIFEPATVEARTVRAMRGSYTLRQAIDALLRGTDLTAQYGDGSVIVRGRDVSAAPDANGATDAEIVVTGTHIRGGVPSAPARTFSRRQIEEQGFRDLGELARSIPQNFSGGQNPGVAGGGNQGTGNENSSSSSALNLRGLGPAATLTLLNSHRLAYDTIGQGVDLSQIPVNAISRVEIVTDGSSALYGADAIGGVANVILRRDYSGVFASAHLGGSTDGGNTRQQFDLVTGHRWTSGGAMVAASYSDIGAITAAQRDYTRSLNRTSTLVPWQRQFSVVGSGHQSLTERLTLEVDGQVNRRLSERAAPNLTTADVLTNGLLARPRVTSATANATLRWNVGNDWRVSASATYGISNNRIFSRRFAAASESLRIALNYDNSIVVTEASAEGPLLSFPGGEARVALGGGYRTNGLDVLVRQTAAGTTRTTTDISSKRDVYYGYGELSLPFVGAANGRPLLEEFHVNLAARYETYPGNASLLTPKIGIVYAPHQAFRLRANWGKSFRTQTLFQQYQAMQGALLPAAAFRSSPTTLPVLILAGGNPRLGPERADTWSAGITIEPAQIPGLTIEATYFNIHYRDRVVVPVTSIVDVFSNPIFRDYVALAPSASRVSTAVAMVPEGLNNLTGGPFDPAAVGAIVDSTLQNAARQKLDGVDILARYRVVLPDDGFVQFDASASYLQSDQQLSPRQPLLPLAGTIFNPPHWRSRLGGTWQRRTVTLSVFGSHIGGTRDTRYDPAAQVGGFTTLDMTGQLRSGATDGPFAGVVFGASVLNLFNAKPDAINNPVATYPPYDSTNYSVAGRVIALTLSKAFK